MPFDRKEYNKKYYELNKEKYQKVYYNKEKQYQNNKKSIERKKEISDFKAKYYKDICDKFYLLFEFKDDKNKLFEEFNKIELPVKEISRIEAIKNKQGQDAARETYLFRD